MTPQKHQLLIPKIDNGIVIDHIPCGMGSHILEIIQKFPQMHEYEISLGSHYLSSRMGRKDILKVQGADISQEALNHIALVASGVTIKIIKDYEVIKKYILELPHTIEHILQCPNPSCVCNKERNVKTLFSVFNKKEQEFVCDYCERVYPLSRIGWSK